LSREIRGGGGRRWEGKDEEAGRQRTRVSRTDSTPHHVPLLNLGVMEPGKYTEKDNDE